MKIARLLFKPKWQDKDPAARAAAVAGEDDAELITALPQLARDDADARVRIAALRRLGDYECWRERSTGDADADVRRIAREAYLQLLCATGDTPGIARRIAELDTLSPTELARAATQGASRELRAAAIERVARPSLLVDRALHDPDATLRAQVLERIDDLAALERIAEAARKSDKTISRRARERANALRVDGGEAAAITQRAQNLCTQLESLLRQPGATDAAIAPIEAEWARLGHRAPESVQARFRGSLAIWQRLRAPPPVVRIDDDSPTLVLVDPDAGADQPGADLAGDALHAEAALASTSEFNVDLLHSQARFDAALANAAALAQSERAARRTMLHDLEGHVSRYSGHVEAGDVGAAQHDRDAIAPLRAAIDALPPALATRLAALDERHDELRRWQQWASRQRREAICADLEAFAATQPHPDALAARVRDLREEWRRLDAAAASDAAQATLARRFHALCRQVLKPAAGYFDKRDALRESRAGEIASLLDTAAPLLAGDADAVIDWPAAARLRRELGDALRGLDAVEPRDRTALARRLKEGIGTLATRIETHDGEVERAKQRLIERATALAGSEERGLAKTVQALQQQWTTLGNGRRGTDQRQWQAFRSACDAVFKGLDSARRERNVQQAQADAATTTLLDELQALADAAGAQDAAAVKAGLRVLTSRWQALERAKPEQAQRQRKLVDAIEGGLRERARRTRLARFDDALAAYAEPPRTAPADEPEAGAAVSARRDGDSMQKALLARASAPDEIEEDTARARLVELEFLAGIETPEEDRDRRMHYQLQRLANRLRDRSSVSAEVELEQHLARWFAQTVQSPDLEARFLRAARAALASLP